MLKELLVIIILSYLLWDEVVDQCSSNTQITKKPTAKLKPKLTVENAKLEDIPKLSPADQVKVREKLFFRDEPLKYGDVVEKSDELFSMDAHAAQLWESNGDNGGNVFLRPLNPVASEYSTKNECMCEGFETCDLCSRFNNKTGWGGNVFDAFSFGDEEIDNVDTACVKKAFLRADNMTRSLANNTRALKGDFSKAVVGPGINYRDNQDWWNSGKYRKAATATD